MWAFKSQWQKWFMGFVSIVFGGLLVELLGSLWPLAFAGSAAVLLSWPLIKSIGYVVVTGHYPK
ncbi:hypothetical protein [Photobacterium alginatilyticum]|uniref:DUF2892 domain-containing protein n=1 Tax=Photobacterium alginatilyticum TaxID=1775171 RepID=A0ABW9YKG9_9GAMM|nr:hypothetical protein [Photobacterium alginatilyticum]NBI54200.1 hypothetical protein [Photobacterium alginatilyticum]